MFDAWNLNVTGVKLLKAGAAQRMKTYGTSVFTTQFEYDMYSLGDLDYKHETYNELIGQTLVIDLGHQFQSGDTVSVTVTYETSPEGQAFSWLEPA